MIINVYTTTIRRVNHIVERTRQDKILKPTDTQTSMSTLNDCLTDILLMEASKLKLNPDKTYLVTIGEQGCRILSG